MLYKWQNESGKRIWNWGIEKGKKSSTNGTIWVKWFRYLLHICYCLHCIIIHKQSTVNTYKHMHTHTYIATQTHHVLNYMKKLSRCIVRYCRTSCELAALVDSIFVAVVVDVDVIIIVGVVVFAIALAQLSAKRSCSCSYEPRLEI